MCIIFLLDTKTHSPFRKFSTSSEVPQNPNDLAYFSVFSFTLVYLVLHLCIWFCVCVFGFAFVATIVVVINSKLQPKELYDIKISKGEVLVELFQVLE